MQVLGVIFLWPVSSTLHSVSAGLIPAAAVIGVIDLQQL
jgi:hypothetical protein